MAIKFWNFFFFLYPNAWHNSQIHAREYYGCVIADAKANIFLKLLLLIRNRMSEYNVLMIYMTIYRVQISNSHAFIAIIFTKTAKCNFKSNAKSIKNESGQNSFSINHQLCSFIIISSAKAFATSCPTSYAISLILIVISFIYHNTSLFLSR